MNTAPFPLSDGLFTRFTGKADLIGELSKTQAPADLGPSIDFVAAELDLLAPAVVTLRIRLRRGAPPAPIPRIPAERVLVVQPTDWAVVCDEVCRPHKAVRDCVYEKMEVGGYLPHLANPAGVAPLLEAHVAKWRAPSS